MSGEPGTEPRIMELEDLQARLFTTEADLDTCSDDLETMTEHRDNLAEALGGAIEQMKGIQDLTDISDFERIHRRNT